MTANTPCICRLLHRSQVAEFKANCPPSSTRESCSLSRLWIP